MDLTEPPSTDYRFKDAAGDVWQHTINNPDDWDRDWVFHDDRFDLAGCPDEVSRDQAIAARQGRDRRRSCAVAKVAGRAVTLGVRAGCRSRPAASARRRPVLPLAEYFA